MRTVIVYAHPWNGSLNRAILDSFIKGLKAGGHEIDLIDLNKDKFNPVMSEADLAGYSKGQVLDPMVKDYQARLDKANHLAMIFPMWWSSLPAILKGFIDRVFTQGWAYDYKGMMLEGKLKNIRSATVIYTMNMPRFFYWFLGKPVRKTLITGTLKNCGIKKVKPIELCMAVYSKDEKRKRWLADIEKYARNLK